jgi:MFS family permease
MKLELSIFTWLAFAGATGLWALSILLTRDASGRHAWTWRAIPLSFFGLAWIAFGITFIFRFLVLVSDPDFFQATQYPLWRMPATTFTWSWIALTLYWLAFALGYLFLVRLSPHRPTILERLDLLAAPANLLTLDILVFCCSCLVILSGREVIPRAISTPLAILGGFYAIAATTIWFGYFQGQPYRLRAFLYLIPGVLVYFYSPFRTLIFAVILCVLVPALRARQWMSLPTFLLAMLALLLVTTIGNDYRRSKMKAENYLRQDTTLTDEAWGSTAQHKSPSWVRLINRFHGFDSVALTIHFVPSIFPHSHLNIFTDLIWRVIPRSIMDKKGDSHRGRDFSTTIWAMGERGLTRRPEANISPSMCADLYQINDIPLVVLGAALYGLLVGLLESWQSRGGPLSSCIFLALFGMPVALGIEQEFNFAAATLIQTIIGFFFFLFFLPIFGQADFPRKFANMKRSLRS